LLYFYKFKVFSFFKFFKKNFYKNIKLITFFKKKNIFFKTDLKIKNKIKKKIFKKQPLLRKKNYIFLKKNNLLFNKQKIKRSTLTNFFFKFDFFKKLKQNVNFLKLLFFKKKSTKNKITNFHRKLKKKNFFFLQNFDKLIYLTLIKSQFFFFYQDSKFFIQKGLVYLNGLMNKNFMKFLKIGDVVQIIMCETYFQYIKNIRLFFKRKITFLKYKRWSLLFNSDNFFTYIRWNPNFLKKFLMFRVDTPSFIEIDFTSLTFIILKKETNFFKKKIFFSNFLSFLLLSSYNWKRLT